MTDAVWNTNHALPTLTIEIDPEHIDSIRSYPEGGIAMTVTISKQEAERLLRVLTVAMDAADD
jgi:hypothetical protein